jgi:RNA 3'-phosphate cyclase
MKNVFLPTLKRMGINAEIKVQRYGYYPKGMGEATLTVSPSGSIQPFQMQYFGNLISVKGISVCTFLSDRKVAERQSRAAEESLAQKGFKPEIKIVNDNSNPIQKGSSIALWGETDSGALLGSDAIGELKKMAEAVGKEAAEKLTTELASKATVDTHLADMLVPYTALSKGNSIYITRNISDHIEANIWLAEKMLNARFKIEKINELYRIEKLAET